jgi:phenylacetate-CoA ligase
VTVPSKAWRTRNVRTYPLEELVQIARERSPFYRKLYEPVPREGFRLRDLPIVDQNEFWQVNTIDHNQLLTEPQTEGIVFKSGGSTGAPKFSFYAQEEWESLTEAFGKGMVANGLKPGDRVGNLFYGGELYGSFLLITKSVEKSGIGAVLFPIMGATALPITAEIIRECRINVVAGMPTSILNLAEYVASHEVKGIHIEKLFFAGEFVYPDQRSYLQKVFPDAKILSLGYATVDAGALGYADETCGPNEHRVWGDGIVLEIIDEGTEEVITETEKPGRFIATNLTRRLMPVIRYPVGDRGCWAEPPGRPDRKFRILGRSEEGARLGPITLYLDDVRRVLEGFGERLGILNFQTTLIHREMMDQMIIRVVASAPGDLLKKAEAEILKKLYYEKPVLVELIDGDKIHPPQIEWIDASQLIYNKRTGKLLKLIDERL